MREIEKRTCTRGGNDHVSWGFVTMCDNNDTLDRNKQIYCEDKFREVSVVVEDSKNEESHDKSSE